MTYSQYTKPKYYVIGNKSDLESERVVMKEECDEWVTKFSEDNKIYIENYEISARIGIGVSKLFH